jgi:diacylglycerol kinase family enzyme
MFMGGILRPACTGRQIRGRANLCPVRLLLLVNSSASSVTPRGKVVVQKELAAAHEVTVADTNRRGHATRLAMAAARDGVDVVVVLGGDGTLNETANGLVGTETALAVLPGGSTNVFARTLGLPNDPIAATRPILDALGRGSIRRIGLGSVNGRYFVFHVGIGFDAAVVEAVERRAELKRWAGHPMFVWSTITTWLRRYDHRRPRFAVRTPAAVVDDAYFAVCLNTDPYTYLGSRPISLVPGATLDRALGLVVFRSLSLPTLGRAAATALRGRPLDRVPRLRVERDLTGVCIEGYGAVPYQVDGDFLGETETLELRHQPDVLRLVVPETYGFGTRKIPCQT